MKYIKKGKEPNSLTWHRQQNNADYNNCPTETKEELKEALLKEQKYICCYCMQRIDKHNMKIEHRLPQTDETQGEAQQLNYTNLLAACLGNEGESKHLQHCDTHKGNTKIKINPTSTTCEKLIKFKPNGEIYSDDVVINKDLHETLNLNIQTIINNRKITLDTALKKLEKEYNATWSKELVQKEIDKWKNQHDEKYKPYCEIVVYYLKKKLSTL